MLLCPLLPQDGHRHAHGRRARPAPRPQGARTAARQRPAVLGPEPDGTGGGGPGGHRAPEARRCLRLCPPPAQPRRAGRPPWTMARPGVASIPGVPT